MGASYILLRSFSLRAVLTCWRDLVSRFLSLLAVDRDYLFDCLLCAPSQGKRALDEEFR